jgi:hypothetical protein
MGDAIASPSRNADGSPKNPGATILGDVEGFVESAARQIKAHAHSLGDFITDEEAHVRALAEVAPSDAEAIAHVADEVAPGEAPAVIADVEHIAADAAPIVAAAEHIADEVAPVAEAVAASGV